MHKTRVFHPYLFAIFPILFLYAHNIDQSAVGSVILPILAVIVITFLLIRFLIFLGLNSVKSGLVVSIVAVMFFSYGHIHELLFNFTFKILISNLLSKPILRLGNWVARIDVYLHLLLLSIFLIFSILLITFIIRKKYFNYLQVTKILNVVAGILVLISIFNIGIYSVKTSGYTQDNDIKDSLAIQHLDYLPDIYLIVLDSYARADILQAFYDYNNSEFIRSLTERDFYVASKSYSNYSYTFLSLPSLMNFKYINYLAGLIGEDSHDLRIPYEMIKNNSIANLLQSYGYLFIHVNSTWEGTQSNKYADVEIEYKKGIFKDEFLRVLTQTTMLRVFDSLILEDLAATYLYTFEKLEKTSELKSPKFVFAHVVLPHPPYIFDQDGNVKKHVTMLNQFHAEGWKKKEDYISQLIFLNERVMTIIDKILEGSESPPIIIVQSDHGPFIEGINFKSRVLARMAILNAYHLPGGGDELLYSSITPVNTFRLILSYYFGVDIPLLNDVMHYSDFKKPYKFLFSIGATDRKEHQNEPSM